MLAGKLAHGGCVTFASAAALTLGVATVPVYEIYKVGAAPQWVEGIDLLATIGLRAAVIPHYDNAEGGNHDTRFCYLGERRLRMLESMLAPSTVVLGIDEHTACVFDLDAGTTTVLGRGAVTLRRHGVSTLFASGCTVSIEDLWSAATDDRRPPDAGTVPNGQASGADRGVATPPSLQAETERLERWPVWARSRWPGPVTRGSWSRPSSMRSSSCGTGPATSARGRWPTTSVIGSSQPE